MAGYENDLMTNIPAFGLSFGPGSNTISMGISVGKRHRESGQMSIMTKVLKNNKPLIKTNKRNQPISNYDLNGIIPGHTVFPTITN